MSITTCTDIFLEQGDRLVQMSTQPVSEESFMLFLDGSVRIYNRQQTGSLARAGASSTLKSDQILNSNNKATAISAHPFIPHLCAVGFEDGKILLWYAPQDQLEERHEFHTSQITHVRWLAQGRLLATADGSGKIALLAFNPDTFEVRPLFSHQRNSRIVEILERTSATKNFAANLQVDEETDKFYQQVTTGPLEILVAWERGDVMHILEPNRNVIAISIQNKIQKLFYFEDIDIACVIAVTGEMVVLGWESASWASKRVVLSKSKLEYQINGGIVALGSGKIAYVSTTGSQIKIIDILSMQASVVELDDFIEDFSLVTGEIQFIKGTGIIVPIAGRQEFCVISEKQIQKVIDRFVYIHGNNNYCVASDKLLSPELQPMVYDPITLQVKNIVNLGGENDTYFSSVVCDAEGCNDSIVYSNKSFKQTTTESTSYSFIQFKRPITAVANKQSVAILSQTLKNESATKPDFLDQGFLKARNAFSSAIQTKHRELLLYYGAEQFKVGVDHDIKKMSISLNAAADSGFLLVYGNQYFSVFEFGAAMIPSLKGNFQLNKDDTVINDCVMYGNHIIVAVNKKQNVQDPIFNKSEVLKLTVSGTVAATMPINYQEGKSDRTTVVISKLSIINQHLFLLSPTGSLYYADTKGFQKFIEICRLVKDYVFDDNFTVKLPILDSNDQQVDGPTIGQLQQLSFSYNLQTIVVNDVSSSLLLEGQMIMSFTFKAFNTLLNRMVELPFVMTLQLNINDVTQLINSAAGKEIANSCVSQCRIFDFSPSRVMSSSIDPIGNLAVELINDDLHNFILIGFTASIVRRYRLCNRQVVKFDQFGLLRLILSGFSEADAEQVQQNHENFIGLIEGLLKIKTSPDIRSKLQLRLSICMQEQSICIVQGLFSPFIQPRLETIPFQGVLLQLLSPCIVTGGNQQKNQMLSQSTQLFISNLYSPQLVSDPRPLNQSPKTAYTLSKFIASVENNRFQDAYDSVSQSDSIDIWRQLASLCIKNNYVDILKTCVSHLKSPIISLLLRSCSIGDESGGKNQELASILSIVLADLRNGLALISNKPILHSRTMQQVGLAPLSLSTEQLLQTQGFNSITRKSNVYKMANRLFALGDYEGANCCYSEIFNGTDMYNSNSEKATLIKQNQKQVQQIENIYFDSEKGGLIAAVQAAKQLNTKPALYKAAQLVEKSSSNSSQLFEAAKLYQQAGCMTHAVKCAIECENDDLVYNIGSTTKNTRLSLLSAGYFAKQVGVSEQGDDDDNQESKDFLEKALILYSCSGFTGQAVELCLRTNKIKELAGLLNDIIGTKRDELNLRKGENEEADSKQQRIEAEQRLSKSKISKELLEKSGKILISLKTEDFTVDEYNSFVNVGILALAHAKAVETALQCIASGIIPITEQIADLLTPEDLTSQDNMQITETIGKLLFRAELFNAAVKKFIAINNSYLALSALIKLGNVQKVVKFAQMSRSKQCFIAAGNFLQSQNFRDEPQLMSQIINFYQKAGAFDYLIKFFINCAKEEIDLFNDYEKAMDALREGAKWIGKWILQIQGEQSEENQSLEVQQKLEQLRKEKIYVEENGKLINGFLHLIEFARNNINQVDAAETLGKNSKKLLDVILKTENCMVQVPHILAFRCEFHAQRGEDGRVVEILTKMIEKEIDVQKYVDEAVLQKYGKQCGIVDIQNDVQVDQRYEQLQEDIHIDNADEGYNQPYQQEEQVDDNVDVDIEL